MTHPAPVRPRLARIAGLLALVLPLWLTAATVPDPTPTPDGAASDGFSWTLDRLTIDGQTRRVTNGFTSLQADAFDHLTLIAEPLGELTVAARPFPGAVPAGHFDGRRLDVTVGGHRVTIASTTPYVEAPRTAYARLVEPDVAPATRRAMFVLQVDLDDPRSAPVGAQPARDVFGVFEMVDLMLADADDTADRTVEGRVVDVLSGEPVAGASLVAITQQPDGGARSLPAGAASGPDGRFTLTVPDDATGLRVSRAGYAVRIVRLDGPASDLVIELTPTGGVHGPETGAAPGDAPVPEVFDVVEQEPVLIGGLEALQARIPAALGSGTVYVQFIVDETGRPMDVEILRSPNPTLSEAAVAAVEASAFEPGRQRGRAVKVRYRLPIRFNPSARDDRGDASRTSPRRAGRVSYDVEYSDGLERLRDRGLESIARRGDDPARRMGMSEVATSELTLGASQVRFRVDPEGLTQDVEVVGADSDAIGRFARQVVLISVFAPEAAGRRGEATVTVTEVN